MSNEEAYHKIQKRVKQKKNFFFHFGLYAIIIIFLALINWLTSGRHIYWWVAFPAVCWGTVVAIHGLTVFIFSADGLLGEEWEQKKIAAEMEKRGYSVDQSISTSANEELDINQHLDLKEVKKQINYDEQDLV